MNNFQQIDPKILALIQTGAGILAANDGRRAPSSAIGQGLLGGANAYQENLMQQQMMQMRNDQIDAQRQLFGARADEIAEQRRDRQQKDTTLQGVAQQYGLDPNVVRAFPQIGENLITSKLMPKAPKIGFTPSGVAYDENNPTLKLGENYSKPNDNMPSGVQEYEYAKGQGYKGTFLDFQLAQKRAGASTTNVEVGFPKEQFKNERDLRNDFQGLPTTKAFREVQTSYDQITTALKNPSAANDLAAATKFMKLLDPGSVVRESELGMAMAATGQLDRMGNYYNMLKTGQKLTPSQRKDFAESAQQLYGAAANRYNEAANEYQGMAADYELNPTRVAKPVEVPNPKKASLQDIADTAKASGKTTKQVTDDLKKRGYVIGK